MTRDPDLYRVDREPAMRAVTLVLHQEFDGVFSLETVERYVDETFASLEERATINRFLPILAERRVRTQLGLVAAWRVASRSPAVLFVSQADAGRSRMALALLRRRAGDGVLAWASVGERAAETTFADRVLGELGLTSSADRFLTYDDDLVRMADVVVTLGGEACPLIERRHYEDWTPGSRIDRTLDEVRRTRDLFAARVDHLADELGLPRVA